MPTEPRIETRLLVFLEENIRSIEQVEALLCLASDRSRAWTATELAAALAFRRVYVAEALEHLERRGLVASAHGSERQYRYVASSEHDEVVERLATARTSSPDKVYAVVSQSALRRLRSRAFRLFGAAFLQKREKR